MKYPYGYLEKQEALLRSEDIAAIHKKARTEWKEDHLK
jgi:hypothetical protein